MITAEEQGGKIIIRYGREEPHVLSECETIDNIRRVYEQLAVGTGAGGFWFRPDTLRYFRSKTYGSARWDGAEKVFVFLSSERGPLYRRGYSIRYWDPHTNRIDTRAGFGTLRAARSAEKRIFG